MDVPEKVIEYFVMNGKQYKPALRPPDILEGQVGSCFDTSVLNALTKKYRYVEGVARNPAYPHEWILHAWVTDGVHAFDPTWKIVNNETQSHVLIRSEYFGVEIDTMTVARFMVETEMKCILVNGWRAPSIASKIYPKKLLALYKEDGIPRST